MKTHVFIVRIWLEPRECAGAAPLRRAVIEYVPSGEKRYFHDLEELTLFFLRYFESLSDDTQQRTDGGDQ